MVQNPPFSLNFLKAKGKWYVYVTIPPPSELRYWQFVQLPPGLRPTRIVLRKQSKEPGAVRRLGKLDHLVNDYISDTTSAVIAAATASRSCSVA